MQKRALAAAAVGMWEYPAALAHIEVCLQVAARSRLDAKKRFQHLAQFYDAIACKDWAERAALGKLLLLCCAAAASALFCPCQASKGFR